MQDVQWWMDANETMQSESLPPGTSAKMQNFLPLLRPLNGKEQEDKCLY
jgi:hypothetical protein